jgi:O-antigen ligase
VAIGEHTHPYRARGLRGASVVVVSAIGALVFAVAIQVQPLIGLAIPAVFAVSFACSRYPAAALIAVLALCGIFGSLKAFTGLSATAAADLLLAGLWGALLYRIATKGVRPPGWLWPGVVVLTAYVALTGLEILAAETIQLGFDSFRIAAWHISVIPLIVYAGWTRITYERVARGAVVVAGLVAAYAAFRWLSGPAQAELEFAEQVTGPFNLIGGDLAVFGSFSSRLQLAFWSAAMLPFCVACAFTFRGWWRRIAIAASATLVIPLLVSQGRTGLIGAAIGLLLVLSLGPLLRGFPGVRLGVTVAAAGSALLVGVIAFNMTVGSSPETRDRYVRILNPETDVAYSQRLLKWDLTLDEIEEHPFGQGLGTAGVVGLEHQRTVNVALYNTESSYLRIAFEQGFLVMGLFILGSLALLAGLLRHALTNRDRLRAGLALGSAGTLLSTLVIFTTGEYIDDPSALAVWIVVALGVGASVTSGPDSEPARTT